MNAPIFACTLPAPRFREPPAVLGVTVSGELMEGLLQRLDGAAERHRGLRTEFQRMLGASRAISHRNRELLFELHALQERLRLAPPARLREALSCVEIAEGHANLTERLAMLKLAQAMVRAYEDLGLLELGRAHSGRGARGPASRQARGRS